MQIDGLRERFDLKSDKQAQFVLEYLIDLNATKAALRAGYKGSSVAVTACENLIKPNIQEAIQYLKQERSERTEIDQDFVLRGLQNVVGRCMQAIPVTDRQGNPTGEYRSNLREAIRCLELMGEHLGMWRRRYSSW